MKYCLGQLKYNLKTIKWFIHMENFQHLNKDMFNFGAQLINFCATRIMFPKIIYFNGRIYTKIKSEN